MELILTILFSLLSILVACIIIGFVVFVIYTTLIFRKIHQFFSAIDQEAKKIMADIDGMRDSVKNGGAALASLVVHALSFLKKKIKKSKKEN